MTGKGSSPMGVPTLRIGGRSLANRLAAPDTTSREKFRLVFRQTQDTKKHLFEELMSRLRADPSRPLEAWEVYLLTLHGQKVMIQRLHADGTEFTENDMKAFFDRLLTAPFITPDELMAEVGMRIERHWIPEGEEDS